MSTKLTLTVELSKPEVPLGAGARAESRFGFGVGRPSPPPADVAPGAPVGPGASPTAERVVLESPPPHDPSARTSTKIRTAETGRTPPMVVAPDGARTSR